MERNPLTSQDRKKSQCLESLQEIPAMNSGLAVEAKVTRGVFRTQLNS